MLEYVYTLSPSQKQFAGFALESVLSPVQFVLPTVLSMGLIGGVASMFIPWWQALEASLFGAALGTGISFFLGYLRAKKNSSFEPPERRVRIDAAGFTFVCGKALLSGKWSQNPISRARWGHLILDKDGQTPLVLPPAVTSIPGEVDKILALISSE